MRYILLPVAFTLTCLAGCDRPAPEFRGVEPVRVSVREAAFDVRVKGARAEAIRVNSQWAPRLDGLALQGVAAIEQISGCRVRKLGGDAAVMIAWLDCGQALQPLPREQSYDCDVYKIADGLVEMVCEPA